MDTINELARDERAQRRQVQADAELFNGMMATEAWKRLISLVETVAQNYHSAIMKPIDSNLESCKVEFNKGVLAGLSLATSLPTMKIREAHELRRASDAEE